MPVRNSPHKLARPILREFTWCMTCLRVSLRDWTEERSLQPFSVRCFAETHDGKNCQHCNQLHKTCESVPEGVEGNRFELLACLSWVKMFWSNTAGGYGVSLDSFDEDEASVFMLPNDLVAAISEAIRHLLASFDNFVKSHRRTHGLTGVRVSVETRDAYSQWLSGRVLLVSPAAAVPVSAPDYDKLANEATQHPRLRASEETARSWHTGVLAFREGIRDLVAAAKDEESVEADLVACLETHMGRFPLQPRI